MNSEANSASDTRPRKATNSSKSIAIFGDSIANGLGVANERFPVLLADDLGGFLEDFTASALPISASLEAFRQSRVAPHTALIAHGATEAMIRPAESCLRFLPTRWRRMGWMDPRPYYSRRWTRRLFERVESAIRWRVKNVLIRLCGSSQLMSPEEFQAQLEELVLQLKRRGTQHVFIVLPPDLDERYFPGSPEAQSRYFGSLSISGTEIVDLKNKLSKWDDFFEDRFHPNISGHRRIADLLHDRIRLRW